MNKQLPLVSQKRLSALSILGYIALTSFWIVLSAAVWRGVDFRVDTQVLEAVRTVQSPVLTNMLLWVTKMVNPEIATPVFIGTFALLWYWRRRLLAKVFAVNCIGGVVLANGLKLVFRKIRPEFWLSEVVEKTYSYPSGHALGSVVLYGFLAYGLGRKWPQYRGWIHASAIAFSLLVGYSRLYFGVHWPSDLVGGYIIGFLWTRCCIEWFHQKVVNKKSVGKTAVSPQ